jgi:ubiquinone/menaquinone biosynthesis C-methylase UbiE
MDRALQGQVSRSAADVYEEFFVPALFREPAQHVARAADIRRGQSVLDAACGTGVLAREAVGATGNDRNDGMLAAAKRLAPGINWQRGLAEALPFADRSFDRVFSQFALMFFDDRAAALREMRRIMKPGGRMHAAVCQRQQLRHPRCSRCCNGQTIAMMKIASASGAKPCSPARPRPRGGSPQ